MTEYEQITIHLARLAATSKARNDEMFRCVDILIKRADANNPDAAFVLLEAAKEILA